MAISMAPPRPRKKPREKSKAPGGKSKAILASNLSRPVPMTAITVASMPAHKITVSRPTPLMPR
jgi:hypothetical protein